MSRSIALVKFDNDEVMYACYDGTSDVLCPWLITEKDLNEKFNGSIYDWNDHCWDNYDTIDPDTIMDKEHCDIYIDYGDGFMWINQSASRSKMYITSPLSHYYDDCDESDLIPQWVIDYHITHEWSIEMFRERIEIPDMSVRLISEERLSQEEEEEFFRTREDTPNMSYYEEMLKLFLETMGISIIFSDI